MEIAPGSLRFEVYYHRLGCSIDKGNNSSINKGVFFLSNEKYKKFIFAF
jgi:hypothetical protein